MSDDQNLRDGLRDGEAWAFEELDKTYTARLIRLAASYLGPQAGVRIPPEDVVQSVYRSLYERRETNPLPETGGDLWGLLMSRTRCKVAKRLRDETRKKRDFRREAPVDPAAVGSETIYGHDREVSPEEQAEIEEAAQELKTRVCRMLEQLPETYRAIIRRLLDGATTEEICREFHCADRTVRRAKERARDILTEAPEGKDEGG
jgi:RNA polymerase sigma factor (sigma-70 family)